MALESNFVDARRVGWPLVGRARTATRVALLTTSLLNACAVRRSPAGIHPAPCLALDGAGANAEWVLREAAEERSALDAWCWAVGPAVVTQTTVAAPGAALDSLAVVVWNAHVGYGDLRALIADIRSGAITGGAVRDFVVLLQEVHRTGDNVPAEVPGWAASAARTGNAVPERADVVRVAREEGLSLVYAPSMRNGLAGDGGPPEDRGNAILSSLPMMNPKFVELPFERQRRVAVLASVAGRTARGEAWSLRFASVHLDNRARLGKIYRSFGAARARQAKSLVEALADAGHAVVGGDLNTWETARDPGAVRALRTEFPLPADLPDEGTMELPWVLPALRLDHLFFRLPDGWDAGYRIHDHAYRSDHQPLVGWIRTGDSGLTTGS
jgi:endonuclease/exonuclease/phosphatase family metal-dependent hydrolase